LVVPIYKVGLQLHPQATTTDSLQASWQAADAMGVDSLWVWDHFYPLYGDADAEHYEAFALLAAMAVTTRRATIGAMVACNSYRNPDLLADMSRTIDHLSGGRYVLGIGAGWAERDYHEYGYIFGTPARRLAALSDALPRIKARLAKLNPPPKGPMPILIGGGGEKVTLRLVAEHAQMWNSVSSDLEEIAHKNSVIDKWCAEIGRPPSEIERTALVGADADPEAYLAAGITHLVLSLGAPYDLAPLQRLLDGRS
jgi:probable F420-dependent oxidoreductase